jgi:hypothetical protein
MEERNPFLHLGRKRDMTTNERTESQGNGGINAGADSLSVVPKTKLHSQDPAVKWDKFGGARPTRSGVVALYAQPTEPHSVGNNPASILPTYDSSVDGEFHNAKRPGYFDVGTGTYYTHGHESLASIAHLIFGNSDAVYRLKEINPDLPEHGVLNPGTGVRLYFER